MTDSVHSASTVDVEANADDASAVDADAEDKLLVTSDTSCATLSTNFSTWDD